MKKLLKNLIYSVLSLFKYDGAVILMYHSVGYNNESFTVTTEEFAQQMEYLKNNNFNVISLANLVKMLENNNPIPNKTIAVTFDDGYEDNYSNAFPILKKYNFPATIFINTANIGKVETGRKGSQLKILSVAEINEMDSSSFISFESHAHTHTKLTSLNSQDVHRQFQDSKNSLKSILDRDAEFIAYPSGRVNKDIEKLAKEYFRAGLGVQKGRVMYGDGIMNLKRNSIDLAVSLAQFKGIAVFGRV